ncbi:MAG TPA: VTT domain-containing protein [Micromonosporaceae bacterium]|jgi:membrane-associated protein
MPGTLLAVEILSSGPLDFINPAYLVPTVGLVGVLAIIFAETGLLVGFFFPGDSLLFLAGVAASPFVNQIPGLEQMQRFNLAALLIGTPVCAIAGAQLGHLLGARYGPRMFDRPNSRLFKRAYVEKAEYYFAKFGPAKAVILARFIPVVRTFLNPVAGLLEMPARRFFIYNAIGAVIWTDGILLLGYGLAKKLSGVPNIDKYILPAVALIVLVSVSPIAVELYRGRRARRVGEPAEASDDGDVGRHRA